MIYAELDTGNFIFRLFASSEEEAIELLKKSWAKHKRLTGAYYTWDILEDSVRIFDLKINEVIKN